MRITQQQLRQIIREELVRSMGLGLLSEAVKDLHGYSVSSPSDVVWGPDKMIYPKERNPFVGGSPAFESWYNDGQQSVRFKGVRNVGTPDEETYFGRSYIYFNEGDWVLVPTIWDQMGAPAQILTIEQRPVGGVTGAEDMDTVPVATLRFDLPGARTLTNVGLAFLVKLNSDRTMDGETGRDRAWQKSSDAMSAYRSGVDSREEREARAAEREARRAAREMQLSPPPPETPPPARPLTALRRPGGVAAPPPPRRPVAMSGDEVRDMLGLRRRE
jgi:hypothetical protein